MIGNSELHPCATRWAETGGPAVALFLPLTGLADGGYLVVIDGSADADAPPLLGNDTRDNALASDLHWVSNHLPGQFELQLERSSDSPISRRQEKETATAHVLSFHFEFWKRRALSRFSRFNPARKFYAVSPETPLIRWTVLLHSTL